jgi:hypothetical protein
MNPWDIPESVEQQIEEVAKTLGGTHTAAEKKLLEIAAVVRDLADEMRSGVMGDRDRLSWADHLAHLHGEER